MCGVALALGQRDMNEDPILETIASLAWQAAHDSITGLPNRRQMQELLAQAIAHARKLDHRLAILIVDIDSFRIVNAAVGQAAGDALLAAAAARIANCAVDHHVSRTGDNEFTLLVAEESPDSVLILASSVLAAFQEPFDIAGRDVHVTVSIGIADVERDGEGTDSLFRAAAAAL